MLVELLADPVLAPLTGYDGSHRAMAEVKRSTSSLPDGWSRRRCSPPGNASGPGRLRRYAADLVVPRAVRAQCALLKGLALRYVLRRPGARERAVRQREILAELAHSLAERAPDALDPVFAALWRQAADDAARLRVVIDQIASLTDPAATAWHHRLTAN